MAGDDATWRVYLPEWVTVYTSDRLEVDGKAECRAHFAAKYAGRVRDGDWRIFGVRHFRPDRRCLQLCLPSLKGEFKDEDAAEALRKELILQLHPVPSVVRRGSPEEQALLDYGRKMLPAGADGGEA